MEKRCTILAKNASAARKTEYLLKKRNIDCTCHIGRYAGEIGELTEKITRREGKHTLLVVGGDGLLNEVVNNVCDYSAITLGLIPAGSGNDFARAMGIPKDPEKALERILNCKEPSLMDLGFVRSPGNPDRKFVVSAGCGFDAAVCHAVDHFPLKKPLGKLGLAQIVYTMIGLPKAVACRHIPAKIRADGDLIFDKPVFFSAAMNTCYEGGGYKFCPDADPASGALELITVTDLRRTSVPGLLLRCRKGTHAGKSQIYIRRARKIDMRFACPVAVHTDGEAYAVAKEITMALADEKLRFLL